MEHDQRIMEGRTPGAVLDGLLAGGSTQVSHCPRPVPQDMGQDMLVDIGEILEAGDGPIFPEDMPGARPPQPVLPSCGLW